MGSFLRRGAQSSGFLQVGLGKAVMSASNRRLVAGALLVIGVLAILNPGYSSVSVDGPTGVIRTQKFSFGPGSLIVFTRVVADDASIRIEQN